MTMPVSLLYDLISIEMIKMEGLEYKKPINEAEELRKVLNMR